MLVDVTSRVELREIYGHRLEGRWTVILVLLLVVGTCIYCIERIGTTGLAAWNAGDELRSTLQRYEWEGVKWTDGKEAIAQLSATYSSLRWKTAAYVVMMAVVCLVSAYMFHGLKY